MHTCSLCHKCEKGPCEWKYFCSNRGKLLKHFKPLSHNTQKPIQNKDSTKPFLAFCRLFLFYPNNHSWVLQKWISICVTNHFQIVFKTFCIVSVPFHHSSSCETWRWITEANKSLLIIREWKKMETSIGFIFCKWMNKTVLYHQRIVACTLEENMRGVSFL